MEREKENKEDKLLLDLFQAYYNARRNKRYTWNALRFEMNYEERVFALWRELMERCYQLSRSICFINYKPVQREIFAADFRDRIVHHLIFNYLNPVVEPGFIKDSYSCRKGKGVHYGIRRVQSFIRGCSRNYTQEAWILKLDILGYFMNIDRSILYGIILRKLQAVRSPLDFNNGLLIYLLEQVIFNDPTQHCIVRGAASDWRGLPKTKSLFHAPPGKGFPIGNLTSQLFGNIYLNEFDHFLGGKLGIKYYGRYVDDFVLINQDREFLKSLIPVIRAYLKEQLGLELHPRKIYLQPYHKGVAFLGTYIKPYRTYIGKRTKNNFYQAIQHWNGIMANKNGRLDEPELDTFIATMNSYLGMLKHYNTYRLRKKLLWKLRPEFFNYVYISGGYTKLVSKRRKIKNPHQ